MGQTAEPHILTPDQRLRVFISSTPEELASERAAVKDAIEALHLVPVMFELGARPYPPREVYAGYLEQSHVFVGIYGEAYGWIEPEMTISGIEDEYELAAAKPRLLYIKRDAPGRDPRLMALIERFKDEAGVSFARFSDANELARLIKNDLVVLLSEHFLDGDASRQGGEPALDKRAIHVPLSHLIGRAKELREITKLLADLRLVTITGPGGIGKTRLALEVLQRLEEPGLEGPWVVELAGLQEPDLVPSAVAQTLGLVTEAGRGTEQALGEVIAERKGLLVLDNCEHVVGATSKLVAELLNDCPNLRALATSREALSVRGEMIYPLDPLPVTLEGVDVDPLDGDAMRMFEARAADLIPGFRLDDANRDAVRKICEALDGLPLAIELAASRLRLLSPQQLAERLDDRFALLSRGPRDLPDRHRALGATIDWSFELLEGAEQQLFTQVSVFRGGFELDAIERVTGEEDFEALDLLDGLVTKSLLTVDLSAEHGRYDLLESLREYGKRRLKPEELEDLQQRHLNWCVELAGAAEAGFRGPEAGGLLDRLDREKDNLRAALTFALETEQYRIALGLAGDLGWFWYRRGYVSEARHWLEQLLAGAPEEATKERAMALLGLAGIEYLDGDMPGAAGHAGDAVEAADAAGHIPTRARALLYTAYFRATLGHLEEAEKLARAGGDLAKGFGLRDIESEIYTALGQLARVQGRAEEAERLFLEGAAIANEIGHRWHEGSSFWLAAKVALDRGDAATAIDRIRAALDLIVAEGDRTSTLVGLHSMSAALAGTGAPEQGAMLIGAVAAAGERIGFFPERMDPLDGAMTIERVRAALDAETYERSYEQGRAMSIEDALGLAGVDAPSERARSRI